MIFEPRVYQALLENFALNNPRCNWFSGMGTGKTAAAIRTFDTLRLYDNVKRACVFAPKRVAQSTWPDELAKWCESFPHLRIAAAIGTPEERRAAVMSSPDILAINYEQIEWLVDGYGENWPFDMVFADESTRLKGLRIGTKQHHITGTEFISGQGAKRARALADIAHKYVRRWVNMTGSPAPNGIIDLWGQMWFVDGGKRLQRSFSAYEQRYFRTYRNSDGYTSWVPMPFSQTHVENAIRDVSITIDARDYFDIKEPIESTVWIDLPPKARRAYDAMQKELFAEIEREGAHKVAVEAFNNSGRAGKCLQIANGTVYYEGKEFVEVHDQKLDALKSVIEEANGASVLIRYCNVPDKIRILKAFPKIKFLDNDPKTVKGFQDGSIPYLLTHAQSAGHGLSFQDNCWILCDYSSSYNLEHDEQIIERIGPTRQMQSGYNRAVYRRRIVARNTLEETSVLPALKEKISVQESLKRAMKRA